MLSSTGCGWPARPAVALANADVSGRSDEHMRRRTCQRCKAVNSKKVLPVPFQKQVAFAMLLVAVHFFQLDSFRLGVQWYATRLPR